CHARDGFAFFLGLILSAGFSWADSISRAPIPARYRLRLRRPGTPRPRQCPGPTPVARQKTPMACGCAPTEAQHALATDFSARAWAGFRPAACVHRHYGHG